jgi:hypothetical protein
MKKLFLTLLLGTVLLAPVLVLAKADNCEDYCNDMNLGLPTGTTCICNPMTADSFEGIIGNIIDFIFKIALFLVPLMVIWGGVLFVSAGGKPEQIKQAQTVIFWSLIGFVVVLLARGLSDLLEEILGI